MTRVFVSYRRSDSEEIAGRICDRLVKEFGKDNVFRDIDSLPVGVDFRVHLREALGASSVMLLVIGPDWVTTEGSGKRSRLDEPEDYVRQEVLLAFELKKVIVPILVAGAEPP